MGNHPAWKKSEQQISEFFGGDGRTSLSGSNSKITGADIIHDTLYVEHKHRARHAILTLWNKIKDAARAENKIPVVTISEKGRPGFWIVVHSSDLTAVANQRLKAKRRI